MRGEKMKKKVVQRTGNKYNLTDFDKNKALGYYQMPLLQPCDYIPKELTSFNAILSSRKKIQVFIFILMIINLKEFGLILTDIY